MLAGWFVRGIESTGITATVKHFVCDDQEQGIFAMDCVVSQRALREMCLRPFAMVMAIGNPGALMTAYNKVNGTHVTDSVALLRDILRKDWKYDSLVTSDW
jgi:beta-glucosidase